MKAKNVDPFVCEEPEVELDRETLDLLKKRMKTANKGHMVSPEEARQQVKEWLSRSSTTKTR